jgi:hypothetical protein
MTALACPRRLCTVLTFAPALIASEAQVCRSVPVQSCRHSATEKARRMTGVQVIISDPKRTRPLVAHRREDVSFVIHGSSMLILSAHEAERLGAFITGRPCIMRHAVTTPAKARFGQVAG